MKRISRRQLLGKVRRVVIKIGSSILTDLPIARIRALASEVALLREGGLDVLVVTSGAISMGLTRLDLKRRPRQMPLLQAAAAVGQIALMQTYEDAMHAHRIPVAQVLLTREDLQNPPRFLRVRHTLMALLDYGVVPVINENDSVSIDEILDGDNDILAAGLPRLVEADLLVLLAAAEGFYATSPRRGGEVISIVHDIDGLATRVNAGIAKGKVQRSLASKVQAAQLAAAGGVPTLVASGIRPGVIGNMLEDESIGTLLLPAKLRRSRKKWIAEDLTPKGWVQVSEEVRQSLIEGHHSLPASAVQKANGQYHLGDAVQVLDATGQEFARGFVSYSFEEIEMIKGKEPAEIEKLLGFKYYGEVIRRDDMVIL